MMGLTPMQRRALDFLRSYIERSGCAPTFEEIAKGLGLASKSGVDRLLTALEQRGAIRRMPNLRRAIEILDDVPPLRRFSDDALLAEVERRGL